MYCFFQVFVVYLLKRKINDGIKLKDKTHPLHLPLYKKTINIINELKND